MLVNRPQGPPHAQYSVADSSLGRAKVYTGEGRHASVPTVAPNTLAAAGTAIGKYCRRARVRVPARPVEEERVSVAGGAHAPPARET